MYVCMYVVASSLVDAGRSVLELAPVRGGAAFSALVGVSLLGQCCGLVGLVWPWSVVWCVPVVGRWFGLRGFGGCWSLVWGAWVVVVSLPGAGGVTELG